MPRAFCLIRPLPHYRSDAFHAGLKACEYEVHTAMKGDIRPDDVLCIWNRYGTNHEYARQFEAAGAKVLVAENGYMGQDADGVQYYALAIGQHNGAGTWHVGGVERWDRLGIELAPWRAGGEHILVRAQRGIGTPEMASPPDWHVKMAEHLRKVTKRPIVIREHPARAVVPPLEEQLQNCWALVTWASSDAGRALVAGVPVFFCAPHLVCEATCRRGVDDLENPLKGDRLPALTALAWGQWSVAEITAGLPFRYLLQGAA